MPDVPKHTISTIRRHEWTIGEDYSEQTDAKNFRYGLHRVYQEMTELGVDLEFDDCFHVRAGDGGQIILFVDIEEEE